MTARDELKRLCAAYHNARLDESVGTDTGETAVANAKFASLAAELDALRAVAEAADVLATTAQLAAWIAPVILLSAQHAKSSRVASSRNTTLFNPQRTDQCSSSQHIFAASRI